MRCRRSRSRRGRRLTGSASICRIRCVGIGGCSRSAGARSGHARRPMTCCGPRACGRVRGRSRARGAVYLFDSGFAPYMSYSTSFEPALGTRFDGQPFTPTKAKQFEVGVRYQSPDRLQNASIAAFDIRQQCPDRRSGASVLQRADGRGAIARDRAGRAGACVEATGCDCCVHLSGYDGAGRYGSDRGRQARGGGAAPSRVALAGLCG